MVVGIVIGSGIFFKAEKILNATGGDLRTGILAWIIGGLIAISNACAFCRHGHPLSEGGGMVDYAEAAVGRAYGYYLLVPGRGLLSLSDQHPGLCPPAIPVSCWATTSSAASA